MRYVTLLITAVMLLGMATAAHPHGKETCGEAVSIEITAEHGRAFLTIPHRDNHKGGIHIIKHYLEARRGENYGIRIRNMTPERIGVVIAVDGRNIISGKRSDLTNDEAMYVINSYGYGCYDGWRTVGDTVHKFYFTDVADSYAVRTFGDTTAMGVIAVAVYREKERPKPLYEHKWFKDTPRAPAAENQARGTAKAFGDERAGTGFGDERYSPTIRVAFEPEKRPVQKTLFKYEWREVLCRKGILHCRREARNRLWDEELYAPYPPGYPRY